MNRSILACVTCALVFWTISDTVAQPALDELESRLDRLREPTTVPPATSPDTSATAAEPGYLGLYADNATAGGAVVTSVETGGPADAAGIRAYDVIASANGAAIRSLDDLSDVLDRLNAGDTVNFSILRDGGTRRISIRLGRRPESAGPDTAGAAPWPSSSSTESYPTTAQPTLGVRVLPVNDETRIRFGLAVRRGAVVDSLRRGGPAQRAGLPIGAVIVSIDGRRVDSPDDLIGYIRTARTGQTVELVFYRGDRIARLNIELGASSGATAASPPPTTSDPPLVLRSPIFGEDRPALRKIESVIDRLVAPPAPVPAVAADETIELRAQVETLNQQVELLQQRIAELERRLAEGGGR